MRTSINLVMAFLVLSIVGCASMDKPSDFPVNNGTCLISHNTVTDKPSTVRMAGKVFQVTKTTLIWDKGHSLPLTQGWGLLELVETPKGVDINLDGVIIGTAAK